MNSVQIRTGIFLQTEITQFSAFSYQVFQLETIFLARANKEREVECSCYERFSMSTLEQSQKRKRNEISQ